MKFRNTLQKSLVLKAVQSLSHPTAEEVYRDISVVHPSVSRGTVYRNLGVLAGQGRLRRVSVPGAADRFDVTLENHYHIRCRMCGRVDDAALPYQAEFLRNISGDNGYLIEWHDIMFQGVCPKCRDSAAPPM